jgi:threonine dehydratase
VGVAALLSGRVPHLEFPLVVVVSGGNIDDSKHKAVLGDNYKSG